MKFSSSLVLAALLSVSQINAVQVRQSTVFIDEKAFEESAPATKVQNSGNVPATKSLKETGVKTPDSVPGVDIAKALGRGSDEAQNTKGLEDRPSKGFPYW